MRKIQPITNVAGSNPGIVDLTLANTYTFKSTPFSFGQDVMQVACTIQRIAGATAVAVSLQGAVKTTPTVDADWFTLMTQATWNVSTPGALLDGTSAVSPNIWLQYRILLIGSAATQWIVKPVGLGQ